MKKVLALVLAVMMLAVVAFAASTDVVNPGNIGSANTPNFMPGETIKVTARGVIDTTTNDPNYTGLPYVFDSGYVKGTNLLIKEINSENYSITSIKYDEGKNLVESVKFNDKNDRVDIKIKQNFDMTKGKTLKMSFDLKGKKVGKSDKPDTIHVVISQTISYGLNKDKTGNTGIVILSDDDVQLPSATGLVDDNNAVIPLPDGGFAEEWVYKVQKASSSDYSYGNMEFTTADDEVEIEVRVYEDDELYLYNETDADDDILKAYADTDADLTFLNFKGAPTFNATATVRIYKEEDTFVYGMKDGKLTNVNAKWDDDEGCFILKTRTLGGYVFSDKKLNVAAADASTNNPDTGANDVVGIATALAAVALVSAAAVSLKK